MSSPIVAGGVIALAIAALYGRTLGYGLFWDDYAALRPRTWEAIAGAWSGAWDPGGVWPAFYRPLALWMYAGLYAAVGQDGPILHGLTLVALGAVAWRMRAVVQAETGDNRLGLVAALWLVAHPETPSSMAAWLSQLFHLAPLFCVLSAIRAWQRGAGGGRAWILALLWLTIGLLFKEDVLVMAPALIAWQVARARIDRALGAPAGADRPAPSFRIVAATMLWVAAYLLWRQAMLGEIGGYEQPEWWLAARNVLSVPLFTVALQWVPGAHIASIASGVGVVALAASAWRARRAAPASLASLAAGGVIIIAAAAAPLVLIAGHTRVHLAVAGAVMLFTAAIGTVARGRDHGVPLGRTTLVALAIGIAGLVTSNWANTSTFAPCAPFWHRTSADVVEWDIVAPEIRDALARAMAACPAKP